MRKNKLYRFLVLLITLFNFIPQKGEAQEQITDALYWFRFQTNLDISPKWTVRFELQERRFLGPDRAHQRVLPEVDIVYHFDNGLNLGFGYTNFSIRSPQTAELPISSVLSEQRYASILKKSWKLQKNDALSLQWKTELRNFDRDPLDGSLNYLDYLIRLRFLAVYKYSFSETLNCKLGDELHLHPEGNTDHQLFDQNRIFTGLSYKTKDWQYALDYIYWYQKNRKGSVFYHRHILRFTLLYTISFY